jgi:hypothetical protein
MLNLENNSKQKLLLSIFFDALGMLSFTLPMIGEFEDVVWAPLAYWLMTKMYAGSTGKVAGIITFIEEILPGLDFIPTFTLTWLYENYFSKKMAQKEKHERIE